MNKSIIKADLNLLKVLHILLEERSVTKASQRLFISQSATSKALSRLRILLQDPVFVRHGMELLPTPTALEWADPLRSAFLQLEGQLAPSSFDPQSALGPLRVAAPEQFALCVIPHLLIRLHSKAPKLRIQCRYRPDDYLEQLAAGSLDFAIDLDHYYPGGFHSTPLLSSLPMIWFREGHPLAKRSDITLEEICYHPLITFQAPNFTADDEALIESRIAEAGLQRNILFDTSHLTIAIGVLLNTDAILLAPDYLATNSGYEGSIVSRTIDHISVFNHMKIKLMLVQHERTLTSPLHRWTVDETCSALGRESGV